MAKQFWLMKSEPESFSIADLARKRTEPWTGVRNYMARFHMRQMAIGDAVLFHHSSCQPPGVAGLARVVRTGVVDETQFDRKGPYYEPRATPDHPVWDCVDVEYVATLPHFVPIERMRADPELAAMVLLKRGMRLSVQPVTEREYERVVAMGQQPWDVGEAPKRARPPAKPAKRSGAKTKSTAAPKRATKPR